MRAADLGAPSASPRSSSRPRRRARRRPVGPSAAPRCRSRQGLPPAMRGCARRRRVPRSPHHRGPYPARRVNVRRRPPPRRLSARAARTYAKSGRRHESTPPRSRVKRELEAHFFAWAVGLGAALAGYARTSASVGGAKRSAGAGRQVASESSSILSSWRSPPAHDHTCKGGDAR